MEFFVVDQSLTKFSSDPLRKKERKKKTLIQHPIIFKKGSKDIAGN